MNTTFTPNPADLSGIPEDARIRRLSMILAENSHEVWAVNKIKNGFVYGPERCDSGNRKTHPLLVPYHELPDSEKDYDISTAVDTFKTLISLDYVIEPKND